MFFLHGNYMAKKKNSFIITILLQFLTCDTTWYAYLTFLT